MKEKRGNALKKNNVSPYLNLGCNGGQWMLPSLLQDHVHLAVTKLGKR